MAFNKKILAGAIAGLLVSGNAGAVVLNGTGTAADPLTFASELTKPAALTAVNDDIAATLSYNFSAGEVRYGRFECTGNIDIDAPTVISSDTTLITVGSVNGAGTEALFFSLTAATPAPPATLGATAGVLLTVDANNQLQDNNAVDCSFSIYDQPSQAQDGGDAGLIYTTESQAFIVSASGLNFASTPGEATAWVEASTGAYTAFTGTPTADNIFGELTLAQVTGVLDYDGTQVTVADIIDLPSASITVSGDFSAASDVTLGGTSATTVTNTDAEFGVTAEFTDADLAYVPNLTDAIQISDYIASLAATANTGYTLGAIADVDAGVINRDGTELQAPLAQVPNGWLSRMVLTNTGADARDYTIQVFGETGNVIGTSNLTGTVPANGTVVVDLDTVLNTFTGKARATLNVTVAAPDKQIQGLYQIVNPASGSISNHVMVRPGTN